jgi:translation initiation factor IF-3
LALPPKKPSSGPYQNRRFPQRRVAEHNINGFIKSPEVRIVGEDIEARVVKLAEAVDIADQLGLDLVEISPNAVPPVCRIVDYKKFLYEQKKKKKEIKANSHKQEVKEVRFGPNTDQHDVDFKVKHAEEFLKAGDKVKALVMFKGREIIYKERGRQLLETFVERLVDFGKVDTGLKMEGRKMTIMIAPKK